MTISGDTAPSRNLVRLAQGSELLLHEAMDFSAMQEIYRHETRETAEATMDHHYKSHTSPHQAGELASAAGVSVLALHHLSPGNVDPAVWRAAEATFAGPVRVPADLETICFARTTIEQTQPEH